MSDIAGMILARLTSAILTLVGVAIVIFSAIRLLPGDITAVLAPRGPEALRLAIVEKFGLDQPAPVQFFKWLGAAVQGDFGNSLITQEPIARTFAQRIPITLELAGIALLISLLVGSAIGIWSAMHHSSRLRAGVGKVGGSLLMSIPDFVLASVFLYVFSRYALGLTVGQWVAASEDLAGHLKAVALPALTLSALGIGLFAVTSRNAVLAVLSQDFIAAAIARGMSPLEILRHHVLRNIAIPMVTTTAILAGYLAGGAVIVEMLYSIPGLGRTLIQAVLNRDYPVIQAAVLLIAAFVVLLNMAADILYRLIDPRLRT